VGATADTLLHQQDWAPDPFDSPDSDGSSGGGRRHCNRRSSSTTSSGSITTPTTGYNMGSTHWLSFILSMGEASYWSSFYDPYIG
jgi:hypothetical protein